MTDFNNIFQSQQKFFLSQQTKELCFRKSNLKKLKHLLKENEPKLYEAIYTDFGKSKFDTFSTELNMLYLEIDYFLKNLNKLMKPRKIGTNLVNMPGSSCLYYDPLGCALVIGAWNYPYQITLLPVIDAMAAGCTCMIKPSEIPANTMRVMAEIINNNFAPEYLYVVEGGVPETTTILEFPFDKIFFTGSPKVGKIVYEAAAKNLIPVTLELGGKSPCVVTESADLKVAARRIVWGKFLNGGQTCVAPDYLLVHQSVKDELLKEIKERIQYSGYTEGAEQYVRIINERNFQRIMSLMDISKIYCGGKTDEKNLYIEPTVLDNISWEDPIMQEEIFGPLLPVLTYETFDNALKAILKLPKPLSAYLFTGNKKEKEQLISVIPFGGGCINDTIMHLINNNLPFGGIGNSGTGHYHGKYGFECFSHLKPVLDKATWGEPDLKYPPYTTNKEKWIERLMK